MSHILRSSKGKSPSVHCVVCVRVAKLLLTATFALLALSLAIMAYRFQGTLTDLLVP